MMPAYSSCRKTFPVYSALGRIGSFALTLAAFGGAPPLGVVRGDVGDIRATIKPDAPTAERFFSVGLAFDGTYLYVNRNGDSTVYLVSPVDGSSPQDRPSFDTGIAEWPAAMSYDPNRNGLWIGTQKSIEGPGFGDCGNPKNANTDMPIYFWDFDNDSVAPVFTIPSDFAVEGASLFTRCRVDGLVYDDGGTAGTLDDDRVWVSDTRNPRIAVFAVSGSFVRGFNAATANASLIALTGLALDTSMIYLANDGVGTVFRTSRSPDPSSGGLLAGSEFVLGGGWFADMACDPNTFAPDTVMWV